MNVLHPSDRVKGNWLIGFVRAQQKEKQEIEEYGIPIHTYRI